MWKALLVLATAVALGGTAILRPFPRRGSAAPAAPAAGPLVRTSDFNPVSGHKFAQQLDHFNPTAKRTWQQRYFSTEPWGSGPAVVMLTGQAATTAFQLQYSHAFEIARDLKGRAFLLEHRFYGESLPTEDMKVDNLRYLSLDQALADIATFISFLRAQGEIPAEAKVVLYGGAYAGNLAAWARIKYPHLVHAAVASSAPLRAQVDFPEYSREMMRLLEKYGGKACADDVRAVASYVESTAKTPAGLLSLVDTFSLCSPFGDKPWDVDLLFNRMAVAVSNTVEMRAENGDIVGEVCQALHQDSDQEKAKQMAAVGGFGMSDDAEPCERIDYEKSIENARKEGWGQAIDDYDEQIFDRPILYQSCTEFGLFRSLGEDWQSRYPVQLSLQKCKDVFGDAFDKDLLEAAVSRTNLEFGSQKPDIRRVIFVHGEDDPMAVLGVQEDLHELAPVIKIAGAQNSNDIPASAATDSAALTEARKQIKQLLVKFLAL